MLSNIHVFLKLESRGWFRKITVYDLYLTSKYDH